MAEYLIDTNVLSEIFYGNLAVRQFVESIDCGVDTVIYIESIQGAIRKTEKEKIKKSLARLKYYPLTSEIALHSIELIDTYSSAHGLFLADAMIAATALHYELTLITYNTKHFRFIKELSVIEPKI